MIKLLRAVFLTNYIASGLYDTTFCNTCVLCTGPTRIRTSVESRSFLIFLHGLRAYYVFLACMVKILIYHSLVIGLIPMWSCDMGILSTPIVVNQVTVNHMRLPLLNQFHKNYPGYSEPISPVPWKYTTTGVDCILSWKTNIFVDTFAIHHIATISPITGSVISFNRYFSLSILFV